MASTILRNAKAEFENLTVKLDVSCYTIAFELVPSTEEIDIGTFCAPAASTLGRTTFTASLTMLWEPALYTALQPWVGATTCIFRFWPDAAIPLQCIRFNTMYAAQPWGRFEVGQRVEVELPLAVLSTPTWSTTGLLREDGGPEIEALPGETPEAKPADEATTTEPEA